MKRILGRNQFLSQERIFEEAPFATDIPWGDSLVGRLINSINRKARISFNKRRISGLAQRLGSIFDEIIETGKIQLPAEKREFLKISNLLGKLKSEVNSGEEVDVLISTSEELIIALNDSSIEKKEDLIDVVKEFLEFLKGIRGSHVSGTKSSSDTVGDSSMYGRMIINLETLKSVITSIQYVSVEGESVPSKAPVVVDESTLKPGQYYQLKDKKVVYVVSLKKGWDGDALPSGKVSVVFLTKSNGVTKFSKSLASKSDFSDHLKDEDVKKLGLKSVNKEAVISESILLEDLNKSTGSRAVISKSEAHAVQAFHKIFKSIGILSSGKNGTGIDESFLNAILSSKNKTETISYVKNLYFQVWEYLFGDKKLTLNPATDSLYKESVELLHDKSKLQAVAEKIARFSFRSLQFEDKDNPLSLKDGNEGLYGQFGDFGIAIQKFNKELKGILQMISNKKKSNESIVHRYTMFLEASSPTSSEVKDKFNDLFTKEIQDRFVVTDKIKSEIESSVKSSDDIIITTADPIIEIVRIFHRAWRIHTPGVIPSGRTGGKVSNSVFREYEYLGGGGGGSPESPGAGPYRNIALYDKWFNSVQDILSDTKYRPIFSEKTIFRFENENGGSGDPVKRGGKILLRFINRLISDSQMYSEKGAMFKFLKEYFGLGEDDLRDTRTDFIGFKDETENEKSASGISKRKVKFTKVDRIDEEFIGELPGSIIKCKLKSKDESKTYYFRNVFNANKSHYFLFTSQTLPYEIHNLSFGSERPQNTPTDNIYLGKIRSSDFKNKVMSIRYFNIVEFMESANPEIIDAVFEMDGDMSVLRDTEDGSVYSKMTKFLPDRRYQKITKDLIQRNVKKMEDHGE